MSIKEMNNLLENYAQVSYKLAISCDHRRDLETFLCSCLWNRPCPFRRLYRRSLCLLDRIYWRSKTSCCLSPPVRCPRRLPILASLLGHPDQRPARVLSTLVLPDPPM